MPAMGTARFVDAHQLVVGDAAFHCEFPLPEDVGDRLPVMKQPEAIAAYEQLCSELAPRRVVELGIRRGGSTALLHALARPDRLVAVDIQDQPAPALSRYIEQNDLGDVVRAHYGVDQADDARLRSIVDNEFADQSLDLVIDDASHRYAPSLASFNVLYPRLRPGGRYVIEDWSSHHRGLDVLAAKLRDASPETLERIERQLSTDPAATQRSLPLARLAIQLVLARASAHDVVAEVAVQRDWVVVTRGAADLGRDFQLSDHYWDHYDFLGDAPPSFLGPQIS